MTPSTVISRTKEFSSAMMLVKSLPWLCITLMMSTRLLSATTVSISLIKLIDTVVRIARFSQRCQQQSHSVIVNAVIVQLIEQCASFVEILQPCSNQIERSELVLHGSHGFYSNRIKPGAVAKYLQPPLMFVASPEIRRRMV